MVSSMDGKMVCDGVGLTIGVQVQDNRTACLSHGLKGNTPDSYPTPPPCANNGKISKSKKNLMETTPRVVWTKALSARTLRRHMQ